MRGDTEAFAAEIAHARNSPGFYDNLSPHVLTILAGTHLLMGEVDEAIRLIRRGLERGSVDMVMEPVVSVMAGPVWETAPFQVLLADYEAEIARLGELY